MLTPATFHDLQGASVFITGGGNGIGAALTEGFLEQGARVAFVGRRDATAFCDEMEQKHGNRPHFTACDVTDTTALQAAMAKAAAAHGPFDTLVANAANDTRIKAGDVTEAWWDESQAVNLKHYFFAAQTAAAMMRPRGRGSIIMFSSITWMMGLAGIAPYVSANAGITGLTRALAREWGPDGLRVNALAPGWVLTERQKELWATPEALAEFLPRQCLRSFMEPADMVGTVLFLASGTSRFMTGQTLVVDAGVVHAG